MARGAPSPSRIKHTDLKPSVSVKVGGEELDPSKAALLFEVVVKKSRSLPDVAVVRLRDPQMNVLASSDFPMGASLEIGLGAPRENATSPVFTGFIAVLEPEFREDGIVHTVRAYDKSHILTRSAHTRVFQDQTVTDIVARVFDAAEITFEGEAVGGPLESVLQSNESDWDFANRMANKVGFEIMMDEGKAKFRRAYTSDGEVGPLTYGGGSGGEGEILYSFLPRISTAGVPDSFNASYVSVQGTKIDTEVKTKPKSPTAKTVTDKVSFGKGLQKAAAFSIPNVVAKTAQEMKAYVEGIHERILASSVEAEGLAIGRPDLRPGKTVEVKNVGPYSDKYLISEVIHTYNDRGYKTRFITSGRARNLFAAVKRPSSTPTGGSDSGTDVILGNSLVRGEVTDNKDPENLGRVRVKLPSLTSDKQAPETWWARIAGPAAGKDRGVLMMPLVGERVLVGFENSDFRSPVVIGSIFEKDFEPGQDLFYDDGSFAVRSQKSMFMKAAEDMKVHVDKAWETKVGDKVKLDATGKIEIKTADDLVIKANNITFEAGMNFTVKAGTNVELKGMMVKVDASANLELKGSAMVTVGGGMVKLG